MFIDHKLEIRKIARNMTIQNSTTVNFPIRRPARRNFRRTAKPTATINTTQRAISAIADTAENCVVANRNGAAKIAGKYRQINIFLIALSMESQCTTRLLSLKGF